MTDPSQLNHPIERSDPPAHARSVAEKVAAAPYAPLWSAAVQSAILLAALIVVEWALLGPGAMSAMIAHPFWIPVILTSLQFGAPSGLVAVLMATLLRDLPVETPGEGYFEFMQRAAMLPIGWVATALIVGEFRQIQLAREAGQLAELRDWRDRAETFAEEIDLLDRRIAEFELDRVVSLESERNRMLRLLSALRGAAPDELPERFAAAAHNLLGAGGARLLLDHGGGYHGDGYFAEPAADHGKAERPPLRLDRADPLAMLLRRSCGVVALSSNRHRRAGSEGAAFATGWAIGVRPAPAEEPAAVIVLEQAQAEGGSGAGLALSMDHRVALEILAAACGAAIRGAATAAEPVRPTPSRHLEAREKSA